MQSETISVARHAREVHILIFEGIARFYLNSSNQEKLDIVLFIYECYMTR